MEQLKVAVENGARKNFDKIVAESVQKGIAVGNIGWIEPFVKAGVNVFGDNGLNLYNSMDFLVAKELLSNFNKSG